VHLEITRRRVMLFLRIAMRSLAGLSGAIGFIADGAACRA
jgi:hypothetical protein